jgi:hypothetical protein
MLTLHTEILCFTRPPRLAWIIDESELQPYRSQRHGRESYPPAQLVSLADWQDEDFSQPTTPP